MRNVDYKMNSMIVKKMCILMVIIFSCQIMADEKLHKEINMSIEQFNKQNLFIYFNQVKANHSDENDKFIESTFLKNYPNLKSYQVDYVKVNCANYLLQRRKNKNYHNKKVLDVIYKNYSSWVKSENFDVKSESIELLGYIDTASSFNEILEIIVSEDKYFYSAAYTVFMHCDSFDNKKFIDAYSGLHEDNKKIIDEYKNGMGQYLKNSGWCDK